MLYQGYASSSPHTLLPFGLVREVSLASAGAPPAGQVAFALDAFPFEDAGDIPAVSWNYLLVAPPHAWRKSADAWRFGPLEGELFGPYGGTYLPAMLPADHPSAVGGRAGRRRGASRSSWSSASSS